MNVLWETPVPSTGFVELTKLIEYPRFLAVRFVCENEDDLDAYELQFFGVVAFKCTYLYALTSDMIKSSYDKLVDLGKSDWLRQAQSSATSYSDEDPSVTQLKHLRICFDEGPCYEFLCSGYNCDIQSKSNL